MDIFLIFFNMKVYCVFSVESPHRGDSNENTQHTIFNRKSKPPQIIPNLQLWNFFQRTQKRVLFKTAIPIFQYSTYLTLPLFQIRHTCFVFYTPAGTRSSTFNFLSFCKQFAGSVYATFCCL